MLLASYLFGFREGCFGGDGRLARVDLAARFADGGFREEFPGATSALGSTASASAMRAIVRRVGFVRPDSIFWTTRGITSISSASSSCVTPIRCRVSEMRTPTRARKASCFASSGLFTARTLPGIPRPNHATKMA